MAVEKTTKGEDFTKQLKAAQALWDTAKTKAEASKSSQFMEFDDGRYVARLMGGTIGKSQSSGRLQVTWSFKFEEGEYEGQTKLDFSGLETETNLYYFGLRLKELGYELPEKTGGLKEILDDVAQTKPLCKIRLKTKGEFQNLYIDKVYAAGDEVEGDTGVAEAAPEEEAEETPAEEVEETEEVEEPEEDADADTVDIQPGMTVIVDSAKGKFKGEVIGLLEDEGKVRVKLEDGRVLRVTGDKLQAVVDEAPPEPKAALKKGRGKK
jgi:hypothetical protein